MLLRSAGVLLLLSVAPASVAQPTVLIPSPEIHSVTAPDGSRHQLLVALPQVYDREPERSFPVLYLLDGNTLFAMVAQTNGYFGTFGGLEPVIIVGLGYPVDDWEAVLRRRTYDYTPSRHEATEAWWHEQFGLEGVRTGGAPAFLELLREQIIPLIDAGYRTQHRRVLGGFSYGGLFGAYALLTEPGLFSGYLLGSPSLGWDGELIFELEAAWAESSPGVPAELFVSAGAMEAGTVDVVERFVERLRGRGYDGLILTTHIFEGETHLSVIPGTMSRGLRVLFDEPAR